MRSHDGVIASDSNLDEFTVYDIQFDFRTYTLYGTQLRPAPPEP
jgi:hypothetical protein